MGQMQSQRVDHLIALHTTLPLTRLVMRTTLESHSDGFSGLQGLECALVSLRPGRVATAVDRTHAHDVLGVGLEPLDHQRHLGPAVRVDIDHHLVHRSELPLAAVPEAVLYLQVNQGDRLASAGSAGRRGDGI